VPVALTFTDVAPNRTALLPTGHAVDLLEAGGHRYEATLINAGAPAALLHADDFGLTGSEDTGALAERLPLLIELRHRAALAMGLTRPGEPVQHAVPKVGIVGPALDYTTSDETW
jgi:hypothetical protein